MNDFDDLMGDALSSRAAATPAALPDAGAAIGRARHHRAVRRTVAVSCVGVLALGAMAGLMLRSPSDTPGVADAPTDNTEPVVTCAPGQILSGEGDVVLHAGQPYAVAAGQCITATAQESVISTCTVTASTGESDASDTAGVVSADGAGCVMLDAAPCPAPPLLGAVVTTTVDVAAGDTAGGDAVACVISCGGFSAFPGPAMTPDGPVSTVFVDADAPFVDANSGGESDSDGSDQPANTVVEACVSMMPPPPLAGTDTTTTSIMPQG